MLTKYLPLVFLLGALSGTQAQTITASSCNASDVQKAFNSVTSSTTTVKIPAGTCTWTSEIRFTVPSGSTNLSILGAGSLSTTGGGDVTTIVDNIGGTDAVLNVTTAGSSSVFRLAGITFEDGNGSIKNSGLFNVGGQSNNVRIDHNHFDYSNRATRAMTADGVNGVADHNIFDLVNGTETNGVVTSDFGADGQGDDSWAANTSLGSSSSFYIENNTFNYGAVNDCQHGGRFVIRFNTINDSSIQTHPTGGAGRGRGCRAWEFYGNTMSASSSSPQFNGFFLSSGTGVIWGNTALTGYESFISIHSMRRDSTTYPESATPNGWGYCGSSNWDQNANSSGYACLDQPGRGKGDQLQGDFPKACDVTSGQCAKQNYNGSWPNEALEPVYEWSDKWAQVPGYPRGFVNNYNPEVLAQNRDFYLWCNSASTTGCTSTFNGTTGTGSGTLSARPSSCTTGVAYWATDQGGWNKSGSGSQGQLYVCTATNTWSLKYTPYTYPHPLTQGSSGGGTAPAAPTNLQGIVH